MSICITILTPNAYRILFGSWYWPLIAAFKMICLPPTNDCSPLKMLHARGPADADLRKALSPGDNRESMRFF
jgi:hypothetical protein